MRYEASFNGFVSMVIMMLLLTSSTLGLRLIARHKQKGSFGKDDLLAIVAFVGIFLCHKLAVRLNVNLGGIPRIDFSGHLW